MKKVIFAAFLLFVSLKLFSQKSGLIEPVHFTLNNAGGDVDRESTSFSYSVGQVFYQLYNKKETLIAEGVQQPIETTEDDKSLEKKKNQISLNIYPNPATDYFTIQSKNTTYDNLSYRLLDLNGKVITTQPIKKSRITVDIASLPVSVYLLTIFNEQESIKTFKLIKN